MRTLIALLIIINVSCQHSVPDSKKKSYWLSMKDSFQFKDLKKFSCDSLSFTSFRNYHKIKNATIDSTIPESDIYLYSWQERDTSKTEFTIIQDQTDHGINIYYLIFDKKDSLLSSTMIAGRGTEVPYIFETKSNLIGKDSVLLISAITDFYDFKTRSKKKVTKGDSTFSKFFFDSKGKVILKEKLQKNEIEYEKNN